MDITQRIVAIFLLACSPLLGGCQSTDNPALIVSTIKPVHALATAIAGEHLQTRQLIPDGVSPHRYALKPSDLQALQQAATVIRVDSTLEPFLNKTFSNLEGTPVLSLAEANGIQHLKVRHHHKHRIHGEHEPQANQTHETFDHYRYDMHLWLNPVNMLAMIDSITDTFSRIDPSHADAYRENARALRTRIQATDAALQQQLAAVRQQPFMVFHDAWQHFDHHYGLNFAGAVTLDASRQPGARHITQIKNQLQAQQAACLFREPQFSPALLDMIVRETQVRTAILDPLGTTIPANADYAVKLLQETADSFIACLATEVH